MLEEYDLQEMRLLGGWVILLNTVEPKIIIRPRAGGSYLVGRASSFQTYGTAQALEKPTTQANIRVVTNITANIPRASNYELIVSSVRFCF